MSQDLSQTIARHIADATYESLPGDAIEAAKRLMLDTLGVAWAGADAEGCRSVYDLTHDQSGKPESTVWAYGKKLPVISAAFVNSLFAGALEYDGLHEVGTLHADIVVLPAALAMAERAHVNGRDFLTALVVADDLVCRLGVSTQKRTGWFYTSVHGVFGAAAVTAKLLGLDRAAVQSAMGLAYLNAAGTQQAAV